MGGSFALWGTFELISKLLQLINSYLSLLFIQEIKMLSLKLILVVWRRDYWTSRFLPKDLTNDECDVPYGLKDNPSIIIKGTDKGSVAVVRERKDYLKEAYKKLDDMEVYQEIPNDPNVLINTIIKALEKIPLHDDLSSDTLNYFLLKDPKFARFYLLPKIHKCLHDVPGRPVISNCGFYTENIFSLLDYHLQPLAQRVKS